MDGLEAGFEDKGNKLSGEHHKMKNVTLVIMAAGIGSRLAAELNSWNRLGRMERLLWIIRSMMRWKRDAIRLSLLSEKDIEKRF